MTETNQQKKQV